MATTTPTLVSATPKVNSITGDTIYTYKYSDGSVYTANASNPTAIFQTYAPGGVKNSITKPVKVTALPDGMLPNPSGADSNYQQTAQQQQAAQQAAQQVTAPVAPTPEPVATVAPTPEPVAPVAPPAPTVVSSGSNRINGVWGQQVQFSDGSVSFYPGSTLPFTAGTPVTNLPTNATVITSAEQAQATQQAAQADQAAQQAAQAQAIAASQAQAQQAAQQYAQTVQAAETAGVQSAAQTTAEIQAQQQLQAQQDAAKAALVEQQRVEAERIAAENAAREAALQQEAADRAAATNAQIESLLQSQASQTAAQQQLVSQTQQSAQELAAINAAQANAGLATNLTGPATLTYNGITYQSTDPNAANYRTPDTLAQIQAVQNAPAAPLSAAALAYQNSAQGAGTSGWYDPIAAGAFTSQAAVERYLQNKEREQPINSWSSLTNSVGDMFANFDKTVNQTIGWDGLAALAVGGMFGPLAGTLTSVAGGIAAGKDPKAVILQAAITYAASYGLNALNDAMTSMAQTATETAVSEGIISPEDAVSIGEEYIDNSLSASDSAAIDAGYDNTSDYYDAIDNGYTDSGSYYETNPGGVAGTGPSIPETTPTGIPETGGPINPQQPYDLHATGTSDMNPGTVYTNQYTGQQEIVLNNGSTVNYADYQAAVASGQPVSVDGYMQTGTIPNVTVYGVEAPVPENPLTFSEGGGTGTVPSTGAGGGGFTTTEPINITVTPTDTGSLMDAINNLTPAQIAAAGGVAALLAGGATAIAAAGGGGAAAAGGASTAATGGAVAPTTPTTVAPVEPTAPTTPTQPTTPVEPTAPTTPTQPTTPVEPTAPTTGGTGTTTTTPTTPVEPTAPTTGGTGTTQPTTPVSPETVAGGAAGGTVAGTTGGTTGATTGTTTGATTGTTGTTGGAGGTATGGTAGTGSTTGPVSPTGTGGATTGGTTGSTTGVVAEQPPAPVTSTTPSGPGTTVTNPAGQTTTTPLPPAEQPPAPVTESGPPQTVKSVADAQAAGFDAETIAKWLAAGLIVSALGSTVPVQPNWSSFYAGQSPWAWGTATPPNVTGGGINPGFLMGQVGPYYQNAGPGQNRFFWGQHPTVTSTQNINQQWNNTPYAPATPYGLATSAVGGTQHLNVPQFIAQTIATPQYQAAAQGSAQYVPIAPATSVVGGTTQPAPIAATPIAPADFVLGGTV